MPVKRRRVFLEIDPLIDSKRRVMIIFSALLALFLAAMDTLIMTAAMPTIVADLGGLHLYSWVYSAYLLARAVSLPIFGKLGDIFKNKSIFLISIGTFLLASIAAGFSTSMAFLIGCRTLQGIGAGGIFSMVYIVLADISPPGERARTMSFASSVWGIASVLGPTLGGFVVSNTSWRWIFFINVPLALMSLVGIGYFLVETREKHKDVSLDIPGVVTLSISILGLLTLFLVGGRDVPWVSPQIMFLVLITMFSGMGFIFFEKRARDPILPLTFFKRKGFALGNLSVFLSSFAIFAFFAFSPIFIQGAQGKSPMQVGIAMLSLSLGWSLGSMIFGQISNRMNTKKAAVIGGICLVVGCSLSLSFHAETSIIYTFMVLQLVGLGMGFVALSTLVIVQNSVDPADLGVATSSHQFARTFGGTVGIGICGGLLMSRLTNTIEMLQEILPESLQIKSQGSLENLIRPEFQGLLPETTIDLLHQSIASNVQVIFWISLLISIACLMTGFFLPEE